MIEGVEFPELQPLENWSEDLQRLALEEIRKNVPKEWRPFYCPVPMCDGLPHETVPSDGWDFPHARWKQHPPKGDWFVWLIRSGRAWGKTKTASNYVNRKARAPIRISLVGKTSKDIRDTMIEGRSGLLATCEPGNVPIYEPSKKKLTWPSGAVAIGYSGEEPDSLRGPQSEVTWLDEPAHIPAIEEVWANLKFSLRDGHDPRVIMTSTPLPSKWMKEIDKNPSTIVTVGSTWENAHNLPDAYKREVLEFYQHTRLGRQEIDGEILFEVEGSLWNRDMIKHVLPGEKPPREWEFDRIVIAIDPAGSARTKSDETGIIVLGRLGDIIYVLADASGKYTPYGWASRAVMLYDHWRADAIVVEVNFGRDMVTETLRSTGATCRIIPVESRRGKVLRAEPVVALYESGHVYHFWDMTELEDQMTTWVPGDSSPDRIDALVHGCTELGMLAKPASAALPWHVTRRVGLLPWSRT